MFRNGNSGQNGRAHLGWVAAFGAASIVGSALLAHQGFALGAPSLTGTTVSTGVPSLTSPMTGSSTGSTTSGTRTSTSAGTASGTCASTGSAADKATLSGSTLTQVSPFANQQILCTQMKTSTPEDLLISVTLECSILTQVSTTGTSTSSASGTIDVWVTVDGNVVPVDTTQPASLTTNGQVTFCNRDATQSFTDGDATQSGSDTLTEYLKTKQADGFDWAKLDTGNGEHTIAVFATFVPGSSCTDATPAPSSTTTNCTGEIGNRTVTIEPTKFAQ